MKQTLLSPQEDKYTKHVYLKFLVDSFLTSHRVVHKFVEFITWLLTYGQPCVGWTTSVGLD